MSDQTHTAPSGDASAAASATAAATASAAASASSATPANDDATTTTAPADPAARIAALEAELADARDRWLRAEAEAQNARNRHRRELDDARQYAVQKFATDVTEAADNLRRGLDALPPAAADEPEVVAKLRGGFEGVERAFLGILERHGVKRHDAAGQPFDPALHQAMAEQPAPEGTAPGHVVTAWTPAWTLNGRLLRPAMVVVASGTPAASAPATAAAAAAGA